MAGLTPASSSLTVEARIKYKERKKIRDNTGKVMQTAGSGSAGLTAALHSELLPAEDVVEEVLQL